MHDHALIGVQIVALGQYAVIFVGLNTYGLGKAAHLLDHSDALDAGKVRYRGIGWVA